MSEDNQDKINSDKLNIDSAIMGILKGNVNAQDAINEEIERKREASFFSFDDDYVDETDYEAEYEAAHADELRRFEEKQREAEKSSEKRSSLADIDRSDEYGYDNQESNYGSHESAFKVDLSEGLKDVGSGSGSGYGNEYGEYGDSDSDPDSDDEKPTLGLNIDFGGNGGGSGASYDEGFKISLARDEDSTGGRKLGEPEPATGGRLGAQMLNAWDYRTLPNKMLELVKNMGNMKQEGTGYFADSESEMLTVLAYLNYGETTGTTESMREQIDEACKTLENRVLSERDDADRYK